MDGNFMHMFGMRMMRFQNSYFMIGNVGKKQNFSLNLSEIIFKNNSVCQRFVSGVFIADIFKPV